MDNIQQQAEEWFDNHFDCYADAEAPVPIPALTKARFLEFAASTALREEVEGLREAFEPLLDAAIGLSYGTDWNHGTHAKIHGYRRKLLDAIPAAKEALTPKT